jgi:hypothetical protein
MIFHPEFPLGDPASLPSHPECGRGVAFGSVSRFSLRATQQGGEVLA